MTHVAKNARGWIARWDAIPLYLRIVGALILGLLVGLVLLFAASEETAARASIALMIPARLILQLLGALAPPLILIAVVHVLMTTKIRGQFAGRMVWLLILNTLVAIFVGLLVANVVQPGRWSKLPAPEKADEKVDEKAKDQAPSPLETLLKNVPRSLLGPLGDQQNVIGVIIIAIAFGLALRRVQDTPLRTLRDLVEIAYKVLLVVLHWIIQIVPLGVFAIVASVVAKEGFQPFIGMGAFIIAVLLALTLQATWYLTRITLGSWVRPLQVVQGMRDAFVMAFSTASSTVTMPVTYACLTEKVGLREESASMGALVGANFNNDGTALYEAMAALFVAQMLGQHLTFYHQLMIVLTSIIASVGAAGIPEAGLVTMTLVFKSVGLPTEYIALLLAVDWFLDRCRTTINVFGDVNVSCLLDGKTREVVEKVSAPEDVGAVSAAEDVGTT